MALRYSLTIAVAALFLSVASVGFEQNDKKECDRTKQKIRDIQSKMRSGYTRAEGEKLEARLRKLREKRRKVCR